MEGCLQAQVQALFTAWTEGSAAVAYTPQGLARAGSEGQLRNAANAALLAMVHARRSSGFYSIRLACWARSQVVDMPNTTPVSPFYSFSVSFIGYLRKRGGQHAANICWPPSHLSPQGNSG